MKQLFLCFLLATGYTGLTGMYAQTLAQDPYIEVTGNAELNIVPDEIFIDVLLTEKYDGKTKIGIQEQEDKMRSSLQALGISAPDMTLQGAHADFMRINWKTDDVLTRKQYTIKVKDAETAGKVFRELGNLEIRNARISRVDHTRMDSLLRAVKTLAVKAAAQKADYLLEAIGEKRGRALIITESQSNMLSNVVLENINGLQRQNRREESERYTGGDDNDDAIQFRKIQLRAAVYAKFAIRP